MLILQECYSFFEVMIVPDRLRNRRLKWSVCLLWILDTRVARRILNVMQARDTKLVLSLNVETWLQLTENSRHIRDPVHSVCMKFQEKITECWYCNCYPCVVLFTSVLHQLANHCCMQYNSGSVKGYGSCLLDLVVCTASVEIFLCTEGTVNSFVKNFDECNA